MRRYWQPLRALTASLCCGCITGAWALTFTEALDRAHSNDPSYLSALASYQAARERVTIAHAALLPQVNFSSSTARNARAYTSRSTFFLPESVSRDQFGTRNAQINLTQALWRRAERIGSEQADLAARQLENQAIAAEHDLFVRLLQSWFDLMAARDNVHFTAMQSAAARQLRDQVRRAAELGLASEPEQEDALARFERALAEQAAAQADEEDKLSSLEQIIGNAERFDPPSLARSQASDVLPEQSLAQWLELVERDNPSLAAATFASRAAAEEVRKQASGHQPTLDLTASYGRSEQSVGNTPGDRGYANTQASVGLQLNVPIYSGGSQSAKVREALALQDKAAQDLENVRRGVRSASRQAWFGIQSAQAREKAAAQAVRSAQAAIRLATLGRQRELKTDLDVLQATQQLYQAQRDLQGAAYLGLLNKIKLRATAGQLTWAEVDALDSAFVPSTRGVAAQTVQASGTAP